MTIYSWQTVNTGNLAEQVCRPTDYFPFPCGVVAMDQEDRDFSRGPVIFGASGLLYPEIAPILEKAVSEKQHPMVAWGIGNNTHYGDRVWWPDWLAKFDLVGLRDHRSPYHYVPCPSCMSPLFAEWRDKPPQHELVIYDQVDYPVKLEVPDTPRMNNCHGKEKLAEVVAFLSSGRVILTSSYHGVYWGYLLNRRVLCWEPWSTKFHTLFPAPVFVNAESWQAHTWKPADTPGYLEDCQRRNTEFHQQVLKLLNL